jgi:hypothetical protein
VAETRYDVGDVATVDASWKVNDALTDPATVTLRVLKPSGATATYVYGTDPEVQKSAVGSYYGQVTVDEPGVWSYRFEGTDPAPGVAAGELQVDPSPFYPDPLSRALCTVQDVKQYVDAPDDTKDGLYARLINAASQAIHREAGREFKPVGAQPSTRTFDLPDLWQTRQRYGYSYDVEIDDLADLDTVAFADWYGNTVTYAGTVTALPRNREDWEPITCLRFTGGYYIPAEGTVAVTGTWGFPKVPEDIRQACVVTVATWDARDVSKFSATFSLDENRVELPHVLPRQVQETVDAYKRRKLLSAVTLSRSY